MHPTFGNSLSREPWIAHPVMILDFAAQEIYERHTEMDGLGRSQWVTPQGTDGTRDATVPSHHPVGAGDHPRWCVVGAMLS